MNKIKKISLPLFLVGAGLLPLISLAATTAAPESPIKDWQGIITLAERVVTWGYRLFFILAVAFILIAAYRYLFARDNAEEVKKANRSLIHAAIAIAVALISTGVAEIIRTFLNQK